MLVPETLLIHFNTWLIILDAAQTHHIIKENFSFQFYFWRANFIDFVLHKQ